MDNLTEQSYMVYFFRRYNKKPIPGFDQISIVAFNRTQAWKVLNDLVLVPSEFNFERSQKFEDFSNE